MFIAGESLTLLWNHAPYRYDYPASLKISAYHPLSRLQSSVRGPFIVPHEVIHASTFLSGVLSP